MNGLKELFDRWTSTTSSSLTATPMRWTLHISQIFCLTVCTPCMITRPWAFHWYQGMVYVDPDSPWMRLLGPFLAKKKSLGVDFWGRDDQDVQHIYKPLLDHIEEVIPERFHKRRYPSPLWTVGRHAERVLREMLLSEYLNFEMPEHFEGKSFEELDELAASFKFENCTQRAGLARILQNDAGMA